MAKLILKFNKKIINEFPITKRRISIGRKTENDLVIENMAVSGKHARIDYKDGHFKITDLKSLNGTFVNDKLVTEQQLNPNDVITIGRHTLVFSTDDIQTLSEKKKILPKDGLILDNKSPTRKILARKRPVSETNKKQTRGVATGQGMISFLSNNDPDFSLERKIVKVGKGKEADIKVSGLLVSRVAAIISRRPTGYYIAALGGVGKLKVNGEVVKDVYRLQEFDIIQLGSSKMQFYYRDN